MRKWQAMALQHHYHEAHPSARFCALSCGGKTSGGPWACVPVEYLDPPLRHARPILTEQKQAKCTLCTWRPAPRPPAATQPSLF